MRKVIGGFLVGVTLASSGVAIASATDSKFDRRDAITCPASVQEDDRVWNFKRLDDGRARIVVFCP